MTADAYPLHWPAGRKRTDSWRREDAKFDVTFARARDDLVHEVQLLCGGRFAKPSLVISTNIALRRDGLPLAGQRQPEDTGVAVYFARYQRQLSFACDRWKKVEHNMRAIAKTIEALRGIDRWGTGDMLEAAFTGFEALPAPAAAKRTWWDVLECRPDASPSVVQDQYRRLRSQHHPDRGGDSTRFNEVQRAFEEASKS